MFMNQHEWRIYTSVILSKYVFIFVVNGRGGVGQVKLPLQNSGGVGWWKKVLVMLKGEGHNSC